MKSRLKTGDAWNLIHGALPLKSKRPVAQF